MEENKKEEIKKCNINMRVTEEDFNKIKSNADTVNMSVSEYARKCLLKEDISNLFGGYGHIENTNITLDNIGNEKYTICFIKNTVKNKDTFDKIAEKFTEAIFKEKIFFDAYVSSDPDNYSIIIYNTSGVSWLSPSLIGNRDSIAGLERILKEVTREFGDVEYIIEVDNTIAYTNSKEV